jgi:hypothetical protein
MWNKLKGVFRGVGGTVAVSGPVAAFDLATGLVILVVILVPAVLFGVWTVGRFARTEGPDRWRMSSARVQAKEEFREAGEPYTQEDLEERAQEIVFERAAEKQEKKARKEHDVVVQDAQDQAEPAN